MSKPVIVPVIMSGGAGTRLWPLSRQAAPKQMHAIFGQQTLLQQTITRVPHDAGFADPIVVCAQPHIAAVQQQLLQIGVSASQIIAEPVARNTAPCAAIAARAVAETFGPDALVLLLAADHHIANPTAFRAAVHCAANTAVRGHIITFGPTPSRPETGYGYLLAGQEIDGPVRKLQKFVEKPDLTTAKAWLQDGRYLWNSGMFLFAANTMLEECRALRPQIYQATAEAWKNARRSAGHLLLEPQAFASCPAESVDTAIMENTTLGAVIALDAGWSDVGSWTAIYELCEQDENANAVIGPVIHVDTKNCLFRSDGPRIAAIGVCGLAVIATKDAVLVLPLSDAQKVREVVDQLEENER